MNVFCIVAIFALFLCISIQYVASFVPTMKSFHHPMKLQRNVKVTSRLSITSSSSASLLQMSDGFSNGLDDDIREKIDNLVKNNKIVLFMKGNKLFPQW